MITKLNSFTAKHKNTFSAKSCHTKMRESSYIQRIDSILRILKFRGVPNIFRVLHMPNFFCVCGLKSKSEAPLQSISLSSINPVCKKRLRPTRFCSRRVMRQMEQFAVRREWLSSSVRSREQEMKAAGVSIK